MSKYAFPNDALPSVPTVHGSTLVLLAVMDIDWHEGQDKVNLLVEYEAPAEDEDDYDPDDGVIFSRTRYTQVHTVWMDAHYPLWRIQYQLACTLDIDGDARAALVFAPAPQASPPTLPDVSFD